MPGMTETSHVTVRFLAYSLSLEVGLMSITVLITGYNFIVPEM
jgi:hypothetical protein